MASDQIEIRDLLLRGIIGINDWEREKKQDILINITLFGELAPAGDSDRIEDTINYRTLTKAVIEHVESVGRFTVEALATDIVRLCLETPGVERARVRIEKPGALRFARSVGVCIERSASDLG
ncbi:MAG: dihydroneopterin aldolase [Anaerolineales bacterium]